MQLLLLFRTQMGLQLKSEKPDALLLPVTIMIGMGEDEGFAGILGLIGGLFWDLNSAVHLGFNAAFMCISCFCCAALVTYIIRNTFISNFVFSALSAFVYAFLYWLFFIIIKGVHGAELSLFSFIFRPPYTQCLLLRLYGFS